MDYYKFINETQIEKYKSTYIQQSNYICTNPTKKDFLKIGYKELLINKKPKINERTHFLSFRYINRINYIEKIWIVNRIDS